MKRVLAISMLMCVLVVPGAGRADYLTVEGGAFYQHAVAVFFHPDQSWVMVQVLTITGEVRHKTVPEGPAEPPYCPTFVAFSNGDLACGPLNFSMDNITMRTATASGTLNSLYGATITVDVSWTATDTPIPGGGPVIWLPDGSRATIGAIVARVAFGTGTGTVTTSGPLGNFSGTDNHAMLRQISSIYVDEYRS